MKITARKAVDPIIATLLLIAIAVAAGIIVYVYVNSLAGGLTQSGGQQVSDQIAMDAYNYGTISNRSNHHHKGCRVKLRHRVNHLLRRRPSANDCRNAYGHLHSPRRSTPAFGVCTTGQTLTFTIDSTAGVGSNTATSGTSHAIKIVTSTGGTSVFSVVAGRTG